MNVPDDQANGGVIGLGPAVCEPCLFARLFDPDGEHHCTGATAVQVIACVMVPSAPEACPCPCQEPGISTPGSDREVPS
ncbi:hypothetical protein [Streptomyces scopuliridis]|uniref:hypothetical protein n=1 Tax=Streptomyces scopuliridis TaxID=452529 RepID=UPI003420EBBC